MSQFFSHPFYAWPDHLEEMKKQKILFENVILDLLYQNFAFENECQAVCRKTYSPY